MNISSQRLEQWAQRIEEHKIRKTRGNYAGRVVFHCLRLFQ